MRRLALLVALLAAATGATTATAQAAVTISRTAASVTEGGSVAFTISRDFVVLGAQATVTVNLSGTAGCPADVALPGGCTAQVTIPAVGGTRTVTLNAVDDDRDEATEQATATISVSGDTGTGGSDTVDVLDGDDRPSLSVAAATATEGRPLQFAVTKTGPTDLPASVDWAVTRRAGTEAADLGAPLDGTLSFGADETTKTIFVPTVDDATDEDPELVDVTLSNPVEAVITTATAAGTIDDDDAPPAATLTAGQASEGDPVTFGITLARASELPVSVGWTVEPGTATAADLTGPRSGSVAIPAGQTTGSFDVATAEDAVYEGPETFEAVAGSARATGTITDDEPPPVVTAGGAPAAGEGGTLSFSVAKTGATTVPARVRWSAQAGDGDLEGPVSGILTLAPGVTSGTVAVTAAQDAVDELDEPVRFVLTAMSDGDATVGTPDQATGTITDDDTASFAVAGAAADEEAGQLEVPVTLSTPADRNLAVDYRLEPGTATAGADYTDVSGRITIPAGQTRVLIGPSIVDDPDVEPDETFDVVLSNPDAGTPIATARATQTIRNTDTTKPPTGGGGTSTPAADAGATGADAPVAPQGARFAQDDVSPPAPTLAGLKLRGATLSLRFACPATEKLCRGTLSVLTVPDARAKAKKLRRELTLASRVAVLPGGRTATFTLELTPVTRKALRSVKAVKAVAFVVVRDAAGNVGTASTKATLKTR